MDTYNLFTTSESPKYSNSNSQINLLLWFFCLIKSRANRSGITQPFLNLNLIFAWNCVLQIHKKNQNKDLENSNSNILEVPMSRTSYLTVKILMILLVFLISFIWSLLFLYQLCSFKLLIMTKMMKFIIVYLVQTLQLMNSLDRFTTSMKNTCLRKQVLLLRSHFYLMILIKLDVILKSPKKDLMPCLSSH